MLPTSGGARHLARARIGSGAGRRIKPVFADCDPRTVTLAAISAWRQAIEEDVSLREAHRCLKIWRAMWKIAAALGYCVRDADPYYGVRNRAAKGGSETWAEGEAARMFKGAWRLKYYGLAAIIAVAWATQLSPGDVRALRASQLAKDANGMGRGLPSGARQGSRSEGRSTTAPWPLCTPIWKSIGIELHDDAFISRNRSGAPYSSDTLGDDFRDVRIAVFGDGRLAPLPTFAGVERRKPLPGRRHHPRWLTLWETHSAHQTPFSPPIAP